jgi:hypothetical protein
MADKTDDPKTPTGESPVYDRLVEGDDPVVATVDSEPRAETPPPLVEPDEIVVEEEYRPGDTSYADQSAYAPTDVAPETAPAPYEPQAPVAPVAQQAPLAQQYSAPEPQYAPTEAQPQIVYVQTPQAPTPKGNRGYGILISILATIAFTAALVIVMTIVYSSILGRVDFSYLGQAAFYVPSLFFVVALIVLTLIVNRAGWWTYVIGSLFVGVVVYFGTIGALLIGAGILTQGPDVAAELFRQGLVDPFTIAAGLVAREVALWAGAVIASRGRKVKVRNAEALEAHERENLRQRSGR